MKTRNRFPSVNYHLWQPCNARCKFCFATFQDVKQTILPKGHLGKEASLKVVQTLAEAGFEKITFAGGEPTLCPWLKDLVSEAKSCGLTTMIVTNGTMLSDEYLTEMVPGLDWIALSIDSLNPEVLHKSGRWTKQQIEVFRDPMKWYYEKVNLIKSCGIKLKVNTVVHKLNYREDMSNFIINVQPFRWKIFQVLPIQGQNDLQFYDLLITDEQFASFVNRHGGISQISAVEESNDLMTNSYVMIDPAGRLFDNAKGFHSYTKSILDMSIKEILKSVHLDEQKFRKRGGKYDW